MKQRDRFKFAADVLVRESGVTIRKLRSGMSGVAYTDADDWGIAAPEPVGPVSFGVFAHEVGHQLLHRDNSLPRWLEELEAWEFSLAQFERFGLGGVERARARAARSLRYAARKTLRRRCSAETAQAILSRYPAWVFNSFDDPRDAVTSDVFELLVERAREG